MIDVSGPRPLAGDEVLIQVRAAGVGNWDEFVRTGGWDVGRRPPMALGVEAAGLVTAVGSSVTDWASGDEVMTYPLPLRDQGTWAPTLIGSSALIARKPAGVSWEAAAVFPVPALTAVQVLDDAGPSHKRRERQDPVAHERDRRARSDLRDRRREVRAQRSASCNPVARLSALRRLRGRRSSRGDRVQRRSGTPSRSRPRALVRPRADPR